MRLAEQAPRARDGIVRGGSTKRVAGLLLGEVDQAGADRPQPGAVDQDAIGGAFDCEVAEEGVCAEEGEDLVEGVVALVRGIDGEFCEVGGEGRQLLGWTAGSCAQGQEGKVAYDLLVRLIEEN